MKLTFAILIIALAIWSVDSKKHHNKRHNEKKHGHREVKSKSMRFQRNDNDAMDYSQHKLIQILPKKVEHLQILKTLENDFEMDYFNAIRMDMKPIMTVVDPQRKSFLNQLNKSSIPYDIIENNFENLIKNEKRKINEARKKFYQINLLRTLNNNQSYLSFDNIFDFENYHTYDELVQHIDYLSKTYPTKTQKFSIGKTYENRDIVGIKIGDDTKQKIVIECGIHSREWISPAFCIWLTNNLITNNDGEANLYTEKFQFIIVPVLNVDGYIFTHTSNRLWRKTRSRSSLSSCIGADPNRNWDSSWCKQGSSSNPCSETYCGSKPFSEIEAKQMADYLSSLGGIYAYYAVHSYSQLWLYPYGYTTNPCPNAQELQKISDSAIAAIKKVHDTSYQAGSIAKTIYQASGSSIDWAYDTIGLKRGFALELRDTGRYGFQLPPDQILVTCEETWAGLRASLDSMIEIDGLKQNK